VSILVTGTLAIDHIANVVDGFATGDLNGKLDAPEAHWGGCGMNLAYSLTKGVSRGVDSATLADQTGVPWVFYGDDIPQGYLDHLRNCGIDQRAMVAQRDARCACAYIFTRNDHSQLTAFYPGSTHFEPPSPEAVRAIETCSKWIAGPEDDATLLARLEWIAPDVTLYWMPGQYTEVTRANVLQPMLARQPNLVVNETEWRVLQSQVGESALDATVGAVYMTRGSQGASFRVSAQSPWQHQATSTIQPVDPTGCGDAFCATLVANLADGMDPAQAVSVAQQHAASCLQFVGAQHH